MKWPDIAEDGYYWYREQDEDWSIVRTIGSSACFVGDPEYWYGLETFNGRFALMAKPES